jgi:hypothetical protein
VPVSLRADWSIVYKTLAIELTVIGQALHGLVVENSIREVGDIGEGLRVVCIREQLQDLKENAKLLIEDELQEFGDLRPLGS